LIRSSPQRAHATAARQRSEAFLRRAAQEREPLLWEVAQRFTPRVFGFHQRIGKVLNGSSGTLMPEAARWPAPKPRSWPCGTVSVR